MRLSRRRLGIRLLVVGPDGAGKSTLSAGLVEELQQQGLRVRHVHFVGRATARGDSHSTPHAAKPRGATQYAVLAVRLARHWYSALRRGAALSRWNVDVVIQERGWIDQCIDPLRYRLSQGGAILAARLVGLAPRNDGAIICSGDPRRMVERKPEISVQETERQLREASILFRSLPAVEVDTTSTSIDCAVAASADFVRARRTEVLAALTMSVTPAPDRLEMIATVRSSRGRRALYRPHSLGGALARQVAAPIGRAPAERAHMVADVVCQLGVPADAVAAIRSSGRQRIVIAVDRHSAVAEFIKVAWGDREGLEREARVLASLGDTPGFRVPEVLSLDHRAQWTALRLARVEGASFPRIGGLENAVDVAVGLRFAQNGKGVTHGDLAPWNLLAGAPPALVDWESGSLDFTPGEDLAHFAAATATGRTIDWEPTTAAFSRYLRETGLVDVLSVDDMRALTQLCVRRRGGHEGA